MKNNSNSNRKRKRKRKIVIHIIKDDFFFQDLYKLHGWEVIGTVMTTRSVKKKIMFRMEAILGEKKGEEHN